MGGKQVFEYLSQKLAIKDGETTRDNQFSLEQVACVGACGMAPVVVVDEDSFGNVSVQGTEDIISRYADQKNEKKGPTGEK
jgi:NADH-quinone oxidoreductase subunit E